MEAILIVSGGLDSVTMAYMYRRLNPVEDLMMLSFDYGQRHAHKELECAARAARYLAMEHHIINMDFLSPLMKSALTDTSIDVPEGHYAAETMKATVVPNRNALMLNIGIAAAVTYGARHVGTGVHAGDHAVYPDCRPHFIEAQTAVARIANEGFIHPDFSIIAPFIYATKADIARRALDVAVPLHKTWSCYKGGEIHCGRCSTCVERLEALHEAEAGPRDRTYYADTEFWKEAVNV